MYARNDANRPSKTKCHLDILAARKCAFRRSSRECLLHIDLADHKAFLGVAQRLALIARISCIICEFVLSCMLQGELCTPLILLLLVDRGVDVRVVRRFRSTRLGLIE